MLFLNCLGPVLPGNSSKYRFHVSDLAAPPYEFIKGFIKLLGRFDYVRLGELADIYQKSLEIIAF